MSKQYQTGFRQFTCPDCGATWSGEGEVRVFYPETGEDKLLKSYPEGRHPDNRCPRAAIVVFVDSFGYSEYDNGRDDAGERAYALQQNLISQGWSAVTITDEMVTETEGAMAVRGIAPKGE